MHVAVLHPGGQLMMTGCQDGAVRTWDIENGLQIGPTFHHGAAVHSIAFLEYGTKVLTASSDRSLRLWRVPTASRTASP